MGILRLLTFMAAFAIVLGEVCDAASDYTSPESHTSEYHIQLQKELKGIR